VAIEIKKFFVQNTKKPFFKIKNLTGILFFKNILWRSLAGVKGKGTPK
jgi:hypothetical protein